jgi:hypothetical protein
VNRFQRDFNTLGNQVAATVRIVWFDSEGKRFDGTGGRPDLTNEFELQIVDEELATTVNECA